MRQRIINAVPTFSLLLRIALTMLLIAVGFQLLVKAIAFMIAAFIGALAFIIAIVIVLGIFKSFF